MGRVCEQYDADQENIGGPLSPHEVVDRMIDASCARSGDNIAIVGASCVEMVLDLCRRGFSHAGCLAAAGGGNIEFFDTLWIPDVGAARNVAAILERVGRRIHTGGTVVFHDARPATDLNRHIDIGKLRRFLAARGFSCLNQESDGGFGLLLTARKLSADNGALRQAVA